MALCLPTDTVEVNVCNAPTKSHYVVVVPSIQNTVDLLPVRYQY